MYKQTNNCSLVVNLDAEPGLNHVHVLVRIANGFNMKTLEALAIENMPTEQLKQVLEMYWWNFRQYMTIVEARLTYWQMQKWADSLKWNHPIALRLNHKLHKREFRGKQTLMLQQR